MNPKTLLAVIAITIVLIVLILYLKSDDASFLEPENRGPPEVSLNFSQADKSILVAR